MSSRATSSPDTPSIDHFSAEKTPGTMNDSPEISLLTPSSSTDRDAPSCNALLVLENANSMASVCRDRKLFITYLNTMAAKKDTLFCKLQRTMVSPTPEYALGEYDDDVMAVHRLIEACREIESDLAYNWLELQKLCEQGEGLLAAKAAELHMLVEKGAMEILMLTRMLTEFSKRPDPPSEIQYLGVYAANVSMGTQRGGEIFFTKQDTEINLVWVRRRVCLWNEQREMLGRRGNDGVDDGGG
ncbi:hypothetical protein DFP73DRAFT_529901 [Morchella snyderi]|nr:hypothetical protein DFP73DRAFT_529901 [Morchella snyderi]